MIYLYRNSLYGFSVILEKEVVMILILVGLYLDSILKKGRFDIFILSGNIEYIWFMFYIFLYVFFFMKLILKIFLFVWYVLSFEIVIIIIYRVFVYRDKVFFEFFVSNCD